MWAEPIHQRIELTPLQKLSRVRFLSDCIAKVIVKEKRTVEEALQLQAWREERAALMGKPKLAFSA